MIFLCQNLLTLEASALFCFQFSKASNVHSTQELWKDVSNVEQQPKVCV